MQMETRFSLKPVAAHLRLVRLMGLRLEAATAAVITAA